jgi:hypothetical protein
MLAEDRVYFAKDGCIGISAVRAKRVGYCAKAEAIAIDAGGTRFVVLQHILSK